MMVGSHRISLISYIPSTICCVLSQSWLAEAETLTAFSNCEQKPVFQLLLRVVLRQVQLVETRVRAAKPLTAAVRLVNLKTSAAR